MTAAARIAWVFGLLVGCARPSPGAPAAYSEQGSGLPYLCNYTGEAPNVEYRGLNGPYATVERACDELAAWAARFRGWNAAAPCTREPIELPAGAPWAAWVLRIGRSNSGQAREEGAYFLALEGEGGWHLSPRPLEVLTAQSDRVRPLSVTAVGGKIGMNRERERRVLLRVRAEIAAASCDGCAQAGQSSDRPTERRDIFIACDVHERRTECTRSLNEAEGAQVILRNQEATVAARPGGAQSTPRAPRVEAPPRATPALGPTGPKEAVALGHLAHTMDKSFLDADFGVAARRLEEVLDICGLGGCSAATLAKIHVHRGVVLSTTNADFASIEEAFALALALDPRAALPAELATLEMQQTFDVAKARVTASRTTR